jgi:hypothetical protein
MILEIILLSFPVSSHELYSIVRPLSCLDVDNSTCYLFPSKVASLRPLHIVILGMADCMAKQGVQRSSDFVAWLWLHFFFLWPCSCVFSHYDFELFSFLFCRGLFSFELIRMAILRFSLLLFFLFCALFYLWLSAIVRYCVVSVLLPPGFDV